MKHFFFSGRDNFEKSILVDEVISKLAPKRVMGFRTIRRSSSIPDAVSEVYLTDYGESIPIYDENHLIGVLWKDDVYTAFPEVFDHTGLKIMSNISKDTELIIMDEIGLYEMAAPLYSAALLKILDGNVPVLGVLKREDNPFHDVILNNPEVLVVEVTAENQLEAIARARKVLENK